MPTKPNPTKVTRRVKAWAIWHKHKDMIVEVGFVDAGDFIPTKAMFVDENQRPMWQHYHYKLIPVTITYQLPSKHKGKKKIR